jgi:hypothetical protein
MPADLVTMSGFVMNGRVHPHIMLAAPDKSFGGHLEPRTKVVFTFAVVTIGRCRQGSISRSWMIRITGDDQSS